MACLVHHGRIGGRRDPIATHEFRIRHRVPAVARALLDRRRAIRAMQRAADLLCNIIFESRKPIDVHLDVATWLPEVISIAEGESEAAHAQAAIVPGAIHVYDRGIFSFELVAAHGDRASFVHRLREPGPRTPRFKADEERPLTDADRKAGVISDRLGRLAGSQHRAAPPGRYREVVIAVPGEPGNQVRLLTDVLDVPAHVIGQIYQYRWQVELFFRWLKSCARFRGVFSETPDGIRIQFYVCLIAMLLIYLRTGMRPSKYALNLLGMVVAGTASWEEIQPILARRSRERDLARACLERKRAAQPP